MLPFRRDVSYGDHEILETMIEYGRGTVSIVCCKWQQGKCVKDVTASKNAFLSRIFDHWRVMCVLFVRNDESFRKYFSFLQHAQLRMAPTAVVHYGGLEK